MKSPIATFIAVLMLVFWRGTAGQNESKQPITIALTPETPTVKAGTDVSVRVVLTNNSKQPFNAGGCYCGPSGLDSLFTWEVHDHGQLTAKRVYPHPELATGEIILDRVVNPGGEISEGQAVSRLYNMTKPGRYTIQAAVQLPKQTGGGIIKSNEVMVTVTPQPQ